MSEFLRCQYADCTRLGFPCWLPDLTGELSPDRAPNEWYCTEHAHGAGYCWCCGSFWGGIESFEFGNEGKLCENCRWEADSDTFDEDDYDWRDDEDEEHDLECPCADCKEEINLRGPVP